VTIAARIFGGAVFRIPAMGPTMPGEDHVNMDKLLANQGHE
jgi:hypothetical protein